MQNQKTAKVSLKSDSTAEPDVRADKSNSTTYADKEVYELFEKMPKFGIEDIETARYYELDTKTLKDKFDRIKDPKIKEYIVNTLKSEIENKSKHNDDIDIFDELAAPDRIGEVLDLIDAINVFNREYSNIDSSPLWGYQRSSKMVELSKFHKKTTQKALNLDDYKPIEKIKDEYDYRDDVPPDYVGVQFHSDFNTNLQQVPKIESMVNFFKSHNNSKMSDYLYDEYYLKMLEEQNVSKAEIEKLKHFNSKYGVKIILEVNSNFMEVAPEIEAEFNSWKKVSNGQAKLLTVLDTRTTKAGYYDETSAYGQGAKCGYAEFEYSSVSYNPEDFDIKTLRHELTHINDMKKGENINTKYNLDEIMPHKTENGIEIIDFKNCKYKEEFLNAGIPLEHVEYAYNNPLEFIAVASEGDMSKYSPEFKQILIDFGMPEWMFKIQ